TGNHYLAQEYALRTIGDGVPLDDRGGIRIDHDMNSRYQRDMIDKGVREGFRKVYEKHKASKGLPDFNKDAAFFVNNPNIETKLASVYSEFWTVPSRGPKNNNLKAKYFSKVVQLEPGISVILMTKSGGKMDGNDATLFRTRMIEGAGATPSNYQVMK